MKANFKKKGKLQILKHRTEYSIFYFLRIKNDLLVTKIYNTCPACLNFKVSLSEVFIVICQSSMLFLEREKIKFKKKEKRKCGNSKEFLVLIINSIWVDDTTSLGSCLEEQGQHQYTCNM